MERGIKATTVFFNVRGQKDIFYKTADYLTHLKVFSICHKIKL